MYTYINSRLNGRCVCMYACNCVYIFMCMCIHAYICKYMDVYKLYIRTYTHTVYVRSIPHVRITSAMHIHTCTHTYIYV